MDSFEETSLTVFSPTVLKIAQDISRGLHIYTIKKEHKFYGTSNIHFKQNKSIHFTAGEK